MTRTGKLLLIVGLDAACWLALAAVGYLGLRLIGWAS